MRKCLTRLYMKILAECQYKCSVCTREVDYNYERMRFYHLDGDRSNNNQSNLQPVCVYCCGVRNVLFADLFNSSTELIT